MKPTILAFLALSISITAQAQQMNYQGRLTDSSGDPNTNLQETLLFSIYDAPTGGNLVWGQFQKTVDLIDGRFSVKLGTSTGDDGNGNLLSESFGGNRYLQVQVQGESPLPRQQVLASPTALQAANATGLLGDKHKLSVASQASSGNMGAEDFQPDGSQNGVLLETTEGDTTGGGFFLNGDTAVIYNSGDNDLLRLYNSEYYPFGGSWAEPQFTVTELGKMQCGVAKLENRVTVGGPPGFTTTLFNALANTGEVDIEGELTVDGFFADVLPLHLRAWNGSSTGADGVNTLELLRLEGRSSGGASDYWSLCIDIEDQGSGGGTPDEDLLFFQNGFTNGNNSTTDHLKGWIDGGSGGGFVDSSDRRMKKNIEPLSGALKTALALKPSRYHWLSNEDTDTKSLGFIAQEVNDVAPEIVDETAGMHGLKYKGFGVIAIGAIQELAAENTKLKVRLATMEKRMASLSQAVATMQASSTTPVAQN